MKILSENIPGMKIYLRIENEDDFESLRKQLPKARVERIEKCCSVVFKKPKDFEEGRKSLGAKLI